MSDDFLMSNEEFLRKGLLPAGQPGFGWYKVKVGWLTPQEDIEVKQGKKGPYVKFSTLLKTTERAVFRPDPDREDNAIFDGTKPMFGRSFFVEHFLGSQRQRDALKGMQRKLEATGARGAGLGISAGDIHRAFADAECWVQIFHGTNFRDEPEEVVSRWYSSAPERTFVHESERDAFLQQAED